MASFFDKNILSSSDLKRMEELNKAWADTDDDELRKQLHNEAEIIRKSYGYSGGNDGSRFLPDDTGLYTVSTSATDYTDALRDAEMQKQAAYDNQIKQADIDGSNRLRDAYARNMQSKLGIDQTLRASGISGGASESILASADNNYNNVRDNILSETDKAKREISENAARSQSDSDVNIAKIGYESALDRADRLTESEQRDYDRKQDELEFNFKNEQFDYQKEQDAIKNGFEQYDRDYRAEQDALDREYQKEKDAYDRAHAASSASASANNKKISNILKLIENGYYSDSFADILGIPDLQITDSDDVQNAVWKMLSNGVYHDSFPAIVGFPDNILKEYVDSVKYGY